MMELKKERQKLSDQRSALNKLLRDRARQEEINEIISTAISNANIAPLDGGSAYIGESGNNDLIVSLNDIHYGANVDNAWCKYNTDICRDMMNTYLNRIIGIANTHNSENCYVLCAGDSISGNIHYSIAVSNKENVIQQIVGVSELISNFVAELSKHFRTVRFISTAGNHSRINPNKDDAIVEERLDDIVEWYMQARLQNIDNVIINNEHKLDSTMSVIDVRGKTYCLVHGDFDESQTKVQSIQSMVGKSVYAVISGHKHHNATNDVQGIKTIMAGSFLGMDSFCVQKRIVGDPEQMVCVCDSNGVLCSYDIKLN